MNFIFVFSFFDWLRSIEIFFCLFCDKFLFQKPFFKNLFFERKVGSSDYLAFKTSFK
jgi:hypothetical protein